MYIKKSFYHYPKNNTQIDYRTQQLYDDEQAEAQDLERLKRLYLKAPDESPPTEAKQNLQMFYENVSHKYTSGIKVNPVVPSAMQSTFRKDLLSFDHTMAKSLSDAADFGDELKPREAMDKTQETVIHSTNRLTNILWKHDQNFRSYIALCAHADYQKYLFVSERAESTCYRCESLHGRVFSREELTHLDVIPPLHPNCNCKLIGIDDAAEYMYNMDKDGFIRKLNKLFDKVSIDGNIYFLSHDFLRSGLTAESLIALELIDLPTICDGEHSQPKWYDKLGEWVTDFWDDFSSFVDAFLDRGASLFANADDTMDENPLLGLLYWVDAISLGIVTGLYENFQRNYEIYSNDPNAYNFLNLYTHGLVEMITGAVFPEETLSFQHMLDAIGVATLLYGTAKIINRTRSSRLDNDAKVTVESVDDTLYDIAKKNGKIEKVLSADDLNEAHLKLDPTHKPSYTPGTKVYRIKYSGSSRFVRVYGGKSDISGAWIMNADDVAGLTAEQIRDKFALPWTPTEICDVRIPTGTKLEISSAGGVFGQNGGGVQFRFISKYDDKWFTNGRILQ